MARWTQETQNNPEKLFDSAWYTNNQIERQGNRDIVTYACRLYTAFSGKPASRKPGTQRAFSLTAPLLCAQDYLPVQKYTTL